LMGLDKKVEGGRMRFILLNRVGEAVIHAEVPSPVLRETLLECINDA
jgi:3-dehydroquinate synthase